MQYVCHILVFGCISVHTHNKITVQNIFEMYVKNSEAQFNIFLKLKIYLVLTLTYNNFKISFTD